MSENLFKKITIAVTVEDGEKIVTLSEPTPSYVKPIWSVGLTMRECSELAEALLREAKPCITTQGAPSAPSSESYE